jgi:hypothetical protein
MSEAMITSGMSIYRYLPRHGRDKTETVRSGPKPKEIFRLDLRCMRPEQFIDQVRLAAGAAHTVSGKVSLSDGHAVGPGMRVILGSDNLWDTQTVGIAADGSFEIGNVPDGDYCLTPSVKGYRTRGVATSDCAVPVKVTGVDTRGLAITLYPSKPRS